MKWKKWLHVFELGVILFNWLDYIVHNLISQLDFLNWKLERFTFEDSYLWFTFCNKQVLRKLEGRHLRMRLEQSTHSQHTRCRQTERRRRKWQWQPKQGGQTRYMKKWQNYLRHKFEWGLSKFQTLKMFKKLTRRDILTSLVLAWKAGIWWFK